MMKTVLEEFLQIEGVINAALISGDGFLIESVGSVTVDTDALAALGSCAMNFFSQTGSCLDRGEVQQVVLEHNDGCVIIRRINADELLAVVTAAESFPGRIAYILPKITTRVAAVI